MSPVDSQRELIALHRYFLQANRMRTCYDELLARQGAALPGDEHWTDQYIYLCLWYSCLFVVIEGWRELDLCDQQVDVLLGSEYVALLRRFRNGVLHFQKDYWDDRFLDFVREGADSATWARALNSEFGRYFLMRLRSGPAPS